MRSDKTQKAAADEDGIAIWDDDDSGAPSRQQGDQRNSWNLQADPSSACRSEKPPEEGDPSERVHFIVMPDGDLQLARDDTRRRMPRARARIRRGRSGRFGECA